MIRASLLSLRHALYDKWVALPAELARAQIMSISRNYPVSYGVALFVSITLVLMMGGTSFPALHYGTLALHLAISTTLLVRWKQKRDRNWEVVDTRASINAMIVEATAVSFGWFSFLAAAGLGASD